LIFNEERKSRREFEVIIRKSVSFIEDEIKKLSFINNRTPKQEEDLQSFIRSKQETEAIKRPRSLETSTIITTIGVVFGAIFIVVL
jgi:hypothetical protein